MRLQRALPPAEFVSAMQVGLAEFLDPDDPAAAALLQTHEAYEVYSLDLVNFAKTRDLSQSARSVGWRFLTADPSYNTGCHVGLLPARVIAVAQTPDVHIAFHRLRQMEELLQNPTTPGWKRVASQRSNFGLRGLRIPSLLIEGVWLHRPRKNAHDSNTDFFVPCLGFTKAEGDGWAWDLNLLEPYSLQEFHSAIGDSALKRSKRQKTLYPNR